MPCSRSSWTMELKAEPDGSRPTRCHRSLPILPSARDRVKTLDTLWIENGSWASPAVCSPPSSVATAMPIFDRSIRARAGM